MKAERLELVTHYDLERVIFSAAEGVLNLTDITGVEAIKAVMAARRPPIYIGRVIEKPEVTEYLERLGAFVELAASLPKPVDQQG
jgi:hypothetical protein